MEYFLKKRTWWSYIGADLQELFISSQLLVSRVEEWNEKFHDYSFLVFPAAKAYEGFLKKLFLDLNFISGEDYNGKRFRVGKALNPSLESHLRASEGVYDQIVKKFSKKLADQLWETWRQSRNLVFHWFPNEKNALTYTEAIDRIEMVLSALDEAYKECKISIA